MRKTKILNRTDCVPSFFFLLFLLEQFERVHSTQLFNKKIEQILIDIPNGNKLDRTSTLDSLSHHRPTRTHRHDTKKKWLYSPNWTRFGFILCLSNSSLVLSFLHHFWEKCKNVTINFQKQSSQKRMFPPVFLVFVFRIVPPS